VLFALPQRLAAILPIFEHLAEVKIRAGVRMGEISRELEKGAGRPAKILPNGGKNYPKSQVLKDAHISTLAANRYEELAKIEKKDRLGPPREKAQIAAFFLWG
jgi:hypothetical protein